MVKEIIYHNASGQSQRKRIVRYFRKVSPRLTVGQMRSRLGLMSPTSRISELKKLGYRIDKIWIKEIDTLNIEHRNAMYIYLGGPNDEA